MSWGNLGRLPGGRGIRTLKVKLEINSKRLTEGNSRWQVQVKQRCGGGNMIVFSVFNLRKRCNPLIASFHDAPTHRALGVGCTSNGQMHSSASSPKTRHSVSHLDPGMVQMYSGR